MTNNQSQQKLIAKSANDSAIIKFMLLNIAEQMKSIVPLRALYKKKRISNGQVKCNFELASIPGVGYFSEN